MSELYSSYNFSITQYNRNSNKNSVCGEMHVQLHAPKAYVCQEGASEAVVQRCSTKKCSLKIPQNL